jgi:hypothetical protein
MPQRVNQALRHLALVVADEPEVAAACTAALLSGSGDAAVRVRSSENGQVSNFGRAPKLRE